MSLINTQHWILSSKEQSRTSQAQCSHFRSMIYFHKAVMNLQFTIITKYNSGLNWFVELFTLGIDDYRDMEG